MDQLFATLAISGASLVSKAAFSYAQGVAVRQISGFVQRTTADKSSLHKQLVSLQNVLQIKLSIVTPAIDTCEILAAKGNTSLEGILHLSGELKKRLRKLGERVQIDTADSTNGEQGGADQQKEFAAEVLKDVEEVLKTIDNLVPFLQLALQNSGASLGGGLGGSTSPGRLLQASTAVALASGRFVAHSQFGPTQPPDPVQVGSPFPVRVYSLFQSSARAKGLSDFTWREDFAKATVTVQRISATASRTKTSWIAYNLVITEDLNDGRYHEGVDVSKCKMTDVIPGRVNRISVTDLKKLYYSRSGLLLNIDAKSPVLVVKLDSDAVPVVGAGDASGGSNTPVRAKERAGAEYLALELFHDDSHHKPDSDSDLSDSDEDAEEHTDTGSPTKPSNPKSANDATTTTTTTPPPERVHLSVLEYILRLATLEVSEQRSHLEVSDEKLNLYLANEVRRSSRGGDDGAVGGNGTGGMSSQQPPRRHSGQDSPLARKAGGGRTLLGDTFVERLRKAGGESS
ncbi:RanGTP-binding protein-domain-containing protein [Fimicolochytrium jonesii]|uniref:RanGTP-binding protein-domain-containing protein n=1 Tax=Fimicolochytrium jonesii TaxID=1396493 RepID=UPI0022FF0C29|nr:RanGTP-binding protein-domain-containing protein [Fimicolochytrium jonesii]KAI8818781.1 RanGTP-binding protein-domain-containing protein [Fimicolochytrium jonesii]